MILLARGWQVFQLYPLSSRPFFHLLASVAPQAVWGWSAFLTGTARITVLFINGAWRRSPLLRQIGCGFGSMLWCASAMGAASLDYGSPIWAPYAGTFVLDVLSDDFAAQDGRRTVLSERPVMADSSTIDWAWLVGWVGGGFGAALATLWQAGTSKAEPVKGEATVVAASFADPQTFH